MQTKINKKNDNEFELQFKGLTLGKLIAFQSLLSRAETTLQREIQSSFERAAKENELI